MAFWLPALRHLRRQGCRSHELGECRLLSAQPGATDPVSKLILQPRHYAAEPAAVDEPCFSGRTAEAQSSSQSAGHQALLDGLLRIQALETPATLKDNVMLASTLPIRELLGAQAKQWSGDPSDKFWLDQWQKQLDTELEAIDAMKGKYYKDLHSAIKRGSVADLAPTRRLMARWLTPLAAKIRDAQQKVEAVKSFGNVDMRNYGPMIRDFDPDVLATITLQGVMSILMGHSAEQFMVKVQRSNLRPELGKVNALGAIMALGRMVNERVQLEQVRKFHSAHNAWRNQMRKCFRELDETEKEVPREQWGTDMRRQAILRDIHELKAERPELREELLQLGEDDQQWTERFWRHKKGMLRNRSIDVDAIAKLARQNSRKAANARRRIEYEAMAAGEANWNKEVKLKVGGVLYDMLCQTATIHVPQRDEHGQELENAPAVEAPAFWHSITYFNSRREGCIGCHDEVLRNFSLLNEARELLIKRFMPMVIPPTPWTAQWGGGYMLWRCHVMRTRSKRQHDLIARAEAENPFALTQVYEALNALGEQGWRINRHVLDVIERAWDEGGEIAGLPTASISTDFMTPATMQRFRLVNDTPGQLSLMTSTAETTAEAYARKAHNARQAKREREQHSLRCDLNLKLAVARKMREEAAFYYPHNLDFRGRAYPMHIHLQHMGSDMCRSLLQFSDARPLGSEGLRWLCIQLANVFGNSHDKKSFKGRHEFALENLDNVFASAADPLREDDASRWWMQADDPWQCLAVCIELKDAYDSGNPETFVSHHPIQVDGSCNGLQHYAALGRDREGGGNVNLVAAEKPQDVYTALARLVSDYVKLHAEGAIDPVATHEILKGTGVPKETLQETAQLLLPLINRKLVKQTVMTSVYGVTYIGARDQITSRMKERGIDVTKPYFRAACFGAKVTLEQLGSMFSSAQIIMKWLADSASCVAKNTFHEASSDGDEHQIRDADLVQWRTPLGLPVAQPYFKMVRKDVRSTLQIFRLLEPLESINSLKQRTAFPPNFVHSIDSSHMMMTAIACKRAGLAFAGVHDSFWTHAASADEMNEILREKFVELHSKPLLEDLRLQFLEQSPGLIDKLPEVPKSVQPHLDLDEVRHSPYFFS